MQNLLRGFFFLKGALLYEIGEIYGERSMGGVIILGSHMKAVYMQMYAN